MGLLGKPLISFIPRFCKSCLKWENPWIGIMKKCSVFFVNVSSVFSSSWNSFHRYHPASWIIVIIHVEKTLRAMTGEMCWKYFKKKMKITKHIKKQHERFLSPRQRYKKFRYDLQNRKQIFNWQFYLYSHLLGKKLKVHSPLHMFLDILEFRVENKN